MRNNTSHRSALETPKKKDPTKKCPGLAQERNTSVIETI
jgi:hypothetical protein